MVYAQFFLHYMKLLFPETFHLKVNTFYKSSNGLAYFDGRNIENKNTFLPQNTTRLFCQNRIKPVLWADQASTL